MADIYSKRRRACALAKELASILEEDPGFLAGTECSPRTHKCQKVMKNGLQELGEIIPMFLEAAKTEGGDETMVDKTWGDSSESERSKSPEMMSDGGKCAYETHILGLMGILHL